MTTEHGDVTLARVAERFLNSLADDERGGVHADLQRFIRWYGGERTIHELRPADLETYASSVTASAVHGRRQLSTLRSLLSYAKRAGLTKDNLGTHVRLSRVGDRASKAAAAPSGPTVRLTPEGFVQLEKELEDLHGQRPRLAEELKLAMADKDFRENAPLDAAREQQAHIEARIRELENTLRHAVVIRPEDHGGEKTAQIGATLRLRDLASGKDSRFTLVERSEVDPSQGKISVDSPVGRALIGRAPGEEVEVDVPSGKRKFRLEKLESS
jgi:transcription elongation factor GreA